MAPRLRVWQHALPQVSWDGRAAIQVLIPWRRFMVGSTEPSPREIYSCLARLFWLLAGAFILGISAVVISTKTGSAFSSADIFFWLAALIMILARYVDIRYFRGSTVAGHPADMAHWWRYAAIIGGASTMLWLTAHAVARYVM